MQELKEENKIIENSEQEEISRLQKVLEQTLEESYHLRKENEKLQQQQLKNVQKINKLSNQVKQKKIMQKKLMCKSLTVGY